MLPVRSVACPPRAARGSFCKGLVDRRLNPVIRNVDRLKALVDGAIRWVE